MKRYIFPLFLLFTVISLVGCKKTADNYSYDRVNEFIPGYWSVEKVKLKESGTAFAKDVTANFERYKYNFQSDGSLIVSNTETAEKYYGYWYLYENWEWDEDKGEEVKTYGLFGSVEDPDAIYVYRDFDWTNIQMGSRTLTAKEHRSNGKKGANYTYKLSK